MFYRIGFFCLFCVSLVAAEDVYLKTPNISLQNITGTNVGIRPFRKSGVRLEAELLQDKLLVHNYGYGGSGLTLAFGGAEKVLEILDNDEVTAKTVAVLGTGVVGLTVAYDLLEKGYEVHLYADRRHPNLTSNVAAGIWTPLLFPVDIPEEKKDLHRQMLKVAEERFFKSVSGTPEFEGVKVMPYYKLINGSHHDAINTTAGEEVVVHFDNGLIKNGYRAYKLGIDGRLFMESLYSKVKSKGAVWHERNFGCLDDVLNLNEPVIINCMSMGSREIFDDQEFIPVRGQLIYFQFQEEIDYLISQAIPASDYFVMIYPWSDRLILGGVYEIGAEAPSVNADTINTIVRNAEKCFSGEL